MSVITLLSKPGVQADWRDGELKLRVRPGALAPAEVEILKQNKPLVGGAVLLKRLWAAGYELRLERRSDGDGFFLLPRGQCGPGTDMAELFRLYENFHDVAVELLLETCRLLKIDPQEYHAKARKIVLPQGETPETATA